MKRTLRAVLLFAVLLLPCRIIAQGIPFLRNFTVKEYGAHNRNFDIVVDKDGIIYAANFEGVLYYDQAQWRVIRTPGFIRITSLYCDAKGTIWTGGYNYLGKVVVNKRGSFELENIARKESVHGEVSRIWEDGDKLMFAIGDSMTYALKDNKVEKVLNSNLNHSAEDADANVKQLLQIDGDTKAVVTDGNGLIISNGSRQIHITEENGLCSNNIARVVYNGHGMLWGATDNGIFALSVPSVFSHFSANDGLRGEVLSIKKFAGRTYVGTLSGLFVQDGLRFSMVGNINHACWNLVEYKNHLLIATSKGIFYLDANETLTQVNSNSVLSILPADDCYYTGEIDGVYVNDSEHGRKKICDLESVIRILKDDDETIWLQSIDGDIWNRKVAQINFAKAETEKSENEAASMVTNSDGKILIVSALDTEPFSYSEFSYTDKEGVIWLTKNSVGLYAWKDSTLTYYKPFLTPLSDVNVRSMLRDGNQLWIGCEGGLFFVDCSKKDPSMLMSPKLRVRSVMLQNDSVVWGGIGDMPKDLSFSSDERHVLFYYALDNVSLLGKTYYRYSLDGQKWSAWDEDNVTEFVNLIYGNHQLEIQAMDAYGRLSKVESVKFRIAPPFYLHPMMLLFYLAVIILLVYLLVQFRLKRLKADKLRLEKTVRERTAEIMTQKNEIEEKSKSLETALAELHQTQGELIRQEKMATVGKLTQGLIDRILNPLNYINNFSKLSEGLVKDIEANVEDEKEHMDEEVYEDTLDVLGMLRGNLQKVSEHGENTTRTLKAMEEMLKDRSGGIVPMDLTALVRQDEEMVKTYFAKQISEYDIKVSFSTLSGEIRINGNADQLSKTFMSLLGNSVYAIVKKSQRAKYQGEVDFSVRTTADDVLITIRDNGIGIEDTIIDKIFDPFFTTKTTGEAAGVGLYLSREIVQNHRGDISVKSVKGEFTEFIITLPLLKS